MKKFKDLGLSAQTLSAIEKKGFEEPTLIQEQTIPLLLQGDIDIIGQAHTGTGKTAAFGLPLIERLDENAKHVQAIILTPTRELAIQVSEEINSLKGNKNLNVIPIYGGQSIELQLSRLKRNAHIVVGTPGRIIDHINRRSLKLADASYVVLDEADEMLDMGFIDDIRKIIECTGEKRKMLFFSATMPPAIMTIAKTYMKEFKIVTGNNKELTTNLTDLIYFEVFEKDKLEALCRIIDIEIDFYGIVFCRTKNDVDHVTQKLVDRGYDAELLHGDVSQSQRERILKKFKDKKVNILVATDVAARGIDVNDLTHVINYSLPQNPEAYVHRVGRTGRAGKEGTAITFITPSENKQLGFIKRKIKTEIRKEKVPEIEDVINIKKDRLMKNLLEEMDKENLEEYQELAKKLLEGNEPEKVLGAALKYAFRDELSSQNYRNIEQVRGSFVDETGKARLFFSFGKKDKMTPKKLIDFVRSEIKIDERKIRDIQILENFSFMTVPFKEAEMILDTFKRKKKGNNVTVELAKKKKK